MWKFIILALATTAGKSQVFTKQKCPMTFLTQHFQVDKVNKVAAFKLILVSEVLTQ